MQIKLIRTYNKLIKIKGSWDEMVHNSQFDAPFYSWIWYERWWKHFGESYELFIILAENKTGQLLGIAPLMKEKKSLKGLNVTELSFIDNGIGPRNSIIHRNSEQGHQSIHTIVEYLSNQNDEWDYIKLNKIDEDAPYLRNFEKCIKIFNLKIIKITSDKSPYLKIKTDFETYMINTFKRKQRYNIKREAKRLSNEDGYKLICFNKPHEMKNAIEIAFEVSKASWKGKIGTDMTSSEQTKGFYTDLTHHFAQLGQVQIWILFVEEKPIAIEYQLVNKKKIYLLVSDFDEKYKKLSPGTSLLYNIIEKFHEEQISEFDFCGGVYDYKMKWATNIRELISYQVFSKKITSTFIYKCKNTILPMLRKFKPTISL